MSNDLEKWFGNTHGEISNIWIFELNNDSLEFFSDLKINSFGARADVNGTKERYHVRIFTIAFALCLCRWCIIITSTSYTHDVLLWWTKQSDLFVKWWMMNRHHPRTLDSFKAARGKNNTQHQYYFLPPDLMTAIFVEENILRRHIHTPRNFCSREEEELRARKRLGACCLSGHLSFNCVIMGRLR